jgi:flagellar protein FliO/FliZ
VSTLFAAPQAAPVAHPGGISGLGEVTLALLLVLGAIFALAWVLRRVRGMGSRVGDALDVIATVPLGQKERAVLLRVGATQILLGVAPGRVNALYVLPEPLALERTPGAPVSATAPSFRALLMKSLGK